MVARESCDCNNDERKISCVDAATFSGSVNERLAAQHSTGEIKKAYFYFNLNQRTEKMCSFWLTTVLLALRTQLEHVNYHAVTRGPDLTAALEFNQFTLVHNLLAITTANSASSTPASAAGEGAARSAPSIVEAGAKYLIEPRSNEQVNSIDAGSALANSQPIFFDDAALLFNGEIYNYRDLLYEHLDAPDEDHDNIISSGGGSTKNDKLMLNEGEVLIRLYRQLGPEFVKHLDGEFALAVLDFRERKLLFSADVFGTKPLWL